MLKITFELVLCLYSCMHMPCPFVLDVNDFRLYLSYTKYSETLNTCSPLFLHQESYRLF